MKGIILIGVLLMLGGCGVDFSHVRTGHVTKDSEGTAYERQYYVVGVEPACTGSCLQGLEKRHQQWKQYEHHK